MQERVEQRPEWVKEALEHLYPQAEGQIHMPPPVDGVAQKDAAPAPTDAAERRRRSRAEARASLKYPAPMHFGNLDSLCGLLLTAAPAVLVALRTRRWRHARHCR